LNNSQEDQTTGHPKYLARNSQQYKLVVTTNAILGWFAVSIGYWCLSWRNGRSNKWWKLDIQGPQCHETRQV